MVEIKNVTIAGASGDLGVPVLEALLKSGKFNLTVLSRIGSDATFPASVKVIKVDFNSEESLIEALKGQDAVVSTVGSAAYATQPILVNAAIAAGIKRFIPSEFGSNITNPKVAGYPIFKLKVTTAKLLEEKSAANPSFTHTIVHNGPFLDWGLEKWFLVEQNPTRVFDGGNIPFSTTTLASVATAVVGVLSKFEETKNRHIYIEDLHTTQNRLIEIARQVAPEKKWELVPTSTEEIIKDTYAKVAVGDFSTFMDFLMPGIFAEGHGQLYQKLDNELVGVEGKTEAEIEAIWKKILL